MSRRRRRRERGEYPWIWTRPARPSGYKGKRCRKVRRGPSNTVTVEFEDGQTYVVDENGLARA